MSEAQNGGNVMERLTKRLPSGAADYNYPKSCYFGAGSGADRIAQSAFRQRCVDQLAEYEDTGRTPEEVSELDKDLSDLRTIIGECGGLDQVRALAEADKDGRLVVLPCKVGDTIYHIGKVRTSHFDGDKIIIDDNGRWEIYEIPFALMHLPYIGESDFLTHEEAKKALEAKKDE